MGSLFCFFYVFIRFDKTRENQWEEGTPVIRWCRKVQDYCLPDLRSLKTSAHVLLVTRVAPNKNYYRGQHLKYMHLVARDERPALSRKGIRKRNLRSMLSLIEVRLMERRETICNTLFFLVGPFLVACLSCSHYFLLQAGACWMGVRDLCVENLPYTLPLAGLVVIIGDGIAISLQRGSHFSSFSSSILLPP